MPPLSPLKATSLSINEKGEVAWDAQIISLDELQTRFQEAAKAETKPTVQLRADKESKYDTVAQVMSRASEAGLSDIAFVSEN
jgi:biopolymer transport protein ExbD